MINEIHEAYNNKIKSILFGILCDFEKGRDWKKTLNNLQIELLGREEELQSINYYQLMAKLSTLKFLKYEYFRTTIFDCMNLVDKQ